MQLLSVIAAARQAMVAGIGKRSGRKSLRDVSMEELQHRHPEVIAVINRNRMLCVGCLLAAFHDLRDAAFEHEIDEEQLYREIMEAVNSTSTPKPQ